MVIGIDCSRAFGPFWGGPESYSYYLIRAILKTPSEHHFRLYLPPNASRNPRYNDFFSGLSPRHAELTPQRHSEPASPYRGESTRGGGEFVSGSNPNVMPDGDLASIRRLADQAKSFDGELRTAELPGTTVGEEDSGHRQNDEKEKTSKYELKEISWKRLWTQGGLALECLLNPPDVLFVPAHTLPVIHRPGLKTVVTVHDLGAQFLPNYHQFPQKYYLNTTTEYAIMNATKIIAVSNYTKQDIVNKFEYRNPKSETNNKFQILNFKFQIDRKIQVVYEGYDQKTFYPRRLNEVVAVKQKLGISGNYFLFVGTIQPRKNLARLIEAFSKVLKGYRSLTLVLAGAPGWLNQEIYAAPAKFGVSSQVKFLGPVGHRDLPALMTGSLAFTFPSLFEGFGLAPLEAMACGAPVILSHATSLPEVGGEAALYVDPESSQDISERMETILSFSDSQRQMVVGRSLAQAAKFSWEKAASETIRAIEDASSLQVSN